MRRVTTRGRRRRTAILSAVAVGVAVVVVPVWAATAATDAKNLVVNSVARGGADAAPGNGVCETAAGNGVCTLRAAIEESNALKGQPGQVTITVSPSIAAGTKMTGTANFPTTNMISTALEGMDANGANFAVTSPVTIDLGHRLQVDGSANNVNPMAAFFLNGPDIQVRNADSVMSPGTSFVVGPNARRVTIDGDAKNGQFGRITTPNWYAQRFLLIRESAADVTVRNYQLQGFAGNYAGLGLGAATGYGGIFVFNNQKLTTSPPPAASTM
ncbi:MAG: hypothetical protein FWF28_03440, partial [Micrococcales bacterium]|nr:hypothetical protein [Micrococcales bacterium]